jgi:hypothetical protein
MATWSFLGVKSDQGVTLTPHPLLVPWSRKGRVIPLLPLGIVRPVQSLSACTRVHFTCVAPVYCAPIRHLNVRNSLWLSNVRIQNCGMIPAFFLSEACELHYTKTTITSKSQNNAFLSFDRSLIIGQRLLNKSRHVALKETGEYMTERISTEKSMLKLRFENWHIRNVNDNRTLHQTFHSCCGWRAIQTSSWILQSSDIWSRVQCPFVTNVQEKLATHTAGILRPPWKRKQQGSPKVNNKWPINTGPYSRRLYPSFHSLPAQQYWAMSDTEVNSSVNEMRALTCVKCQNCVKNFTGLIEWSHRNFNLQSGIGIWSINVAKCAKRPSN